MQVQSRLFRSRQGLWLLCLAVILAVVPVLGVAEHAAAAAGAKIFLPYAGGTPEVVQVNTAGFGDSRNDYAWSMAWYKGKLYVGTSRNLLCVERATLEFYFPDREYYSAHPDEGITCPEDRYDMNLQAEIWQYTPGVPGSAGTGVWKRVFRSPNTVPNPRALGKFVARDIGFRGMFVYGEPGGEEALYVTGITAGEYIPEMAADNPPRILRTTDGVNFTAVAGAPGVLKTAFGDQLPIGYRASAVYDGRLFVSASGGLTGDGVVVEVTDPNGPQPEFRQITPQGMQVFEMAVYNGYLYVGTGDVKEGYGVWKTKADGTPPYEFIPVVKSGAGRGADITSVVSMYVYMNRLYVGASGWYNTLLPASELIRINADDSWDLVVGNTRTSFLQFKAPISGLPDGFGNPFNAHFWRMQQHDGALFLGTNDWSYGFRTLPELDKLIGFQYGFDVYISCDGQFWFPATYDAFGDGRYNFGVRTMAATPAGGFIGSTNYAQGARTWKARSFTLCDAQAAATASAPQPPSRLEAEIQASGVVLSWDAAPNAVQYHIQRAEHHLNKDVGVTARADLPPQPATAQGRFLPGIAGAGGLPPDAWIPGPFVEIGTTGQPYYVDQTTKPETRYTYQVVADTSQGATTSPSNLVIVPSLRPAATFAELSGAIEAYAARDQLPPSDAAQLSALVGQAEIAAAQGDYAEALDLLAGLQVQTAQIAGSGQDPSQGDLAILTARLARRLSLAEQGLVTIEP